MASTFADLRGLLIDLDGVVYTGQHAVPGATDFLAEARRRGIPFLLVTNNSTASPIDVVTRLGQMGIEARPEEVLTSADATAGYIRARSSEGKRVLVIGERGLSEAMHGQGLQTVTDGSEADWVVVGLDRSFDYAKLTAGTRAILSGAQFVATNADALLPVEGGAVLPGAGSLVAALRAATGKEPVIVGKPQPVLFEQGRELLGGLPPHAVVVIGDRLETDIVGAQRAGMRAILVLTGVSTAEEATRGTPPPDAVAPDLSAVGRLFGWR